MREQWILATKRGDFDGIARACGISPVTARLLVNRGAATPEDVRRFLNGTLADLADPLTMLGVRETRDRLLLAADRGEGVTIAGDYDADGIFSSVILRTVTGKNSVFLFFTMACSSGHRPLPAKI